LRESGGAAGTEGNRQRGLANVAKASLIERKVLTVKKKDKKPVES